MKYIIFYSWQSDLPNNTNRGFIEEVIQKAIKDVNNSDLYELEPSLDRDTMGTPGAPNITQAIIDKIKTCDAFVADISIVTGIANVEERPSPNPNVLLELGYAIALLGWDKIILFCNDIYGTNEDLPFDIRQHRRIGYQLQQEDPKAPKKAELAKHFKSRLIELLEIGKSNISSKYPLLGISWNFIELDSDGDIDSPTESKVIELQRTDDMAITMQSLTEEIELLNGIDGSIDKNWEDKKKTYIEKVNEFIEQIGNSEKERNYIINSNSNRAQKAAIEINNDGNFIASDIKIEIQLPEWLIAFDNFPSDKETPFKPRAPVPMPPIPMTDRIAFGKIGRMETVGSSFLFNKSRRTSGIRLKTNKITLWADRLLHKHSEVHKEDIFYLLALSNAPLGEYILKGKAFCSEYDDWQEIELSINVI